MPYVFNYLTTSEKPSSESKETILDIRAFTVNNITNAVKCLAYNFMLS